MGNTIFQWYLERCIYNCLRWGIDFPLQQLGAIPPMTTIQSNQFLFSQILSQQFLVEKNQYVVATDATLMNPSKESEEVYSAVHRIE